MQRFARRLPGGATALPHSARTALMPPPPLALSVCADCGFLQAVDDVGLPVGGIMGTSAGALIGSMYAAGYSPREVGAGPVGEAFAPPAAARACLMLLLVHCA